MKIILKSLLMPLLVSLPTLGVIACSGASIYSPAPTPIENINISFSKINKMTFNITNRLLTIAETDVTNASGLPTNFWISGVATLRIFYDNVFVEKIGSVYDFNNETKLIDIQTKLQATIINTVSMVIWGYGTDNQAWDLRDFSAVLTYH